MCVWGGTRAPACMASRTCVTTTRLTACSHNRSQVAMGAGRRGGYVLCGPEGLNPKKLKPWNLRSIPHQ